MLKNKFIIFLYFILNLCVHKNKASVPHTSKRKKFKIALNIITLFYSASHPSLFHVPTFKWMPKFV